MNDEFKVRYTIEADEALRKLKEVGDATKEVGDATEQAGDQTAEASKKTDDLTNSMVGMVSAMASLATVKAIFLDTLKQITDEAVKAHSAVAALSRETSNLSANIGGKLTADTVALVGGFAAEAGLSPAENDKALQFVAAMSDMRKVTKPSEVRDLALAAVTLEKATGGAFGGADGAEALQTVSARLGLTDQQTINMLSGLGNAGFNAKMVTNMAARGADAEMFSLMLASRGQGLPMAQVGEKMDSLLAAVTQVDAEGNLAEPLAAAGITEAMTPVRRLRHLRNAQVAGEISPGQFFSLTGGQANQSMIRAITPALDDPAALAAARAELMDPNGARSAITRRMSSPYAQAEYAENLKALEERSREIRDGQELFAEGAAGFEDTGGIADLFGIAEIARSISGFSHTQAKRDSETRRRIENVKGNLAGVEYFDGVPMQRVVGVDVAPMTNDPGIFEAYGPAGKVMAGTPTGQVINNIVNIINSNLAPDPMRMPSPAQMQE